MLRIYPIKIKDKQYNVAFQKYSESLWHNVLQEAYPQGHATCLCLPFQHGKRKVVIRKLRGGMTFVLARFPNTAQQHQADCQFSLENQDSDTYATVKATPSEEPINAITQSGDVANVRFIYAMNAQKTTGDGIVDKPQKTVTQPQLDRIGTQGLLNFIWELAGLNHWFKHFKGKRTYASTFFRINRAIQSVSVGGFPLNHSLLLPATTKADEERNKRLTQDAWLDNRLLILLSMLPTYSSEKHKPFPKGLPVRGYAGMPWREITNTQWRDMSASNRYAMSAWQEGVNIIALSVLQPQSISTAKVIDTALLPVTDYFVPVLNEREHYIAQRLYNENRNFWKPLGFNGETNLPSFYLNDAGAEHPLVIFHAESASDIAVIGENKCYFDNRYGADGWTHWYPNDDLDTPFIEVK